MQTIGGKRAGKKRDAKSPPIDNEVKRIRKGTRIDIHSEVGSFGDVGQSFSDDSNGTTVVYIEGVVKQTRPEDVIHRCLRCYQQVDDVLAHLLQLVVTHLFHSRAFN